MISGELPCLVTGLIIVNARKNNFDQRTVEFKKKKKITEKSS